MSVKEATILRKQGKYREALAKAKEDLTLANNEWTQMSYFWCLYYVCKEELIPQGNSGEMREFLSVMEGLLPTMKDDKGTGKDCYKNLYKRLLPYADVVSKCDDLSKTDPHKAYEDLSEVPITELDDSLHESYGWVLYRYLKACLSIDRFTPSQFTASVTAYLALHNVRPSLLHSMMLYVAVRYAKEHKSDFAFMDFFKAWDPQNMREEDWKGRTDEKGITYKSTAEECASLCFEGIRNGMRDAGTVKWARAFYEKVCEHTPTDGNNMRNYAWLCVLDMDRDKAREIYSELIMQAGDKHYIWHEYAMLAEDDDLKVGLLIKAISIGQSEDYIGKVRLDLAQMLIEHGYYTSAKKEIDTVVCHYQKKGWKIPEQCAPLETQCRDRRDIGTFDSQYYSDIAEDFVYSSLPTEYGYVYNVNKEKRLLRVMDTQSRTLSYKYQKTNLKEGDFAVFRSHEEVRNNTSFRKIVAIKKAPASDALPSFNNCTAVVDNVNESKKLFHIVGIRKDTRRFNLEYVSTTVRYADTSLRPAVGDMLSIVYGDKDENAIRVINLKKSDTEDPRLSKIVEGTLRVMYRGDKSDDTSEPDYGFINDMYVHKSVLRKHNVTEACNVVAKAIVNKDGRWSVYDITRN